MARYKLPDRELYLAPSPAGAYYGVSGNEKDPARKFIQTLLGEKVSPLLTLETLQYFMQMNDPDEALEFLHRLKKLGWIEGLGEEAEAPAGRLEDILSEILPKFSANGKALLADGQGFYISSSGFPHETAEELSGLSANIASLHERYQGVLKNNLGEGSNAWGLIDAAGNSQIGFWPIFIGEQRFVLVIGGLPQLNHSALTKLIWALSIRYGDTGNL